MKRAGRSYVATAIAIGAIALTGCAADMSSASDSRPVFVDGEDWGDETKYPDLGVKFQGLDPNVITNSAFNSTTGVLTVEIEDSQAVLITRRAVDSAVLLNGSPIDDGGNPAVVATVAASNPTVKQIVVVEEDPAGTDSETLIVDFLGGLYSVGSTSGVGFAVDLGGGTTDIVSIRGTSAKDTWYIGSSGQLSFGNDDFPDVSFAGVETMNLALANGDDSFLASNAAAIKGVNGNATADLIVYGGAGKDTIVGGDGADKLYGGLGDDTLNGGALVAIADELYGEDGVDTFLNNTADDGADKIVCGAGVDVVSYAGRTAAVTVSLYQAAATDLDGAGAAPNTEDTFTDADCETLTGSAFNDILHGNLLANTINGGAGDDVLAGWDGADTLNGEAGNDTFDERVFASQGKGGDVFNGGGGLDLVDYSGRTVALVVTMDGRTADDGEGVEKDNVKADVENLRGGAGADKITGNDLNNTFYEIGQLIADSGGDTYLGGGGVDAVHYGDQTNEPGLLGTVYTGRTAAIIATMGDGLANDGLSGENDNIGSDIENLYTGAGVDLVVGNDLDNDLYLGTGATNQVNCGGGDDMVFGTGLTTRVLMPAAPHACEISEGPITP